MTSKLGSSEIRIMNLLWKNGETPAKDIAKAMKSETGWNVNTTYTLIKRCVDKGAVERTDPGFICRATVSKESVADAETDELIEKLYDGSANKLFAALLGKNKLTKEQIEELKRIVSEME